MLVFSSCFRMHRLADVKQLLPQIVPDPGGLPATRLGSAQPERVSLLPGLLLLRRRELLP